MSQRRDGQLAGSHFYLRLLGFLAVMVVAGSGKAVLKQAHESLSCLLYLLRLTI